ncbi:MAG: TetR/AcrR family transcriptional regulator [Smithella sp.]
MEKLKRKEREFNMRRAEILKKAETVFASKGFHNVTMAEIASTSGFSIGSLYQFFEGKENLYTTMIGEKLDLMYTEVRRQTDAAHGILNKIETLIDAHLQFIENNTDFCRLFIKGENAALSEAMTSLRERIIDDYFKHIAFIENLLKDGVESGFLRALPPHDMAQSLFHLIRASSIEWMLKPAKESPSSKKGLIMNIFFNGVKKYD